MEKLKIFVRYPPGGSGHFISLLLLILYGSVTAPKEKNRAHLYADEINAGHDFFKQHESAWWDLFAANTQYNSNLKESTGWFQENFHFIETDQPVYVVHTHATNPEPMVLAFKNTKLIYKDFLLF